MINKPIPPTWEEILLVGFSLYYHYDGERFGFSSGKRFIDWM